MNRDTIPRQEGTVGTARDRVRAEDPRQGWGIGREMDEVRCGGAAIERRGWERAVEFEDMFQREGPRVLGIVYREGCLPSSK